MNKIKKIFLNLKFRKKVILTYFLVSIVPISILGIFCYEQTKQILVAQEKENLGESFLQAIERMENLTTSYSNLASYTTFNTAILKVVNHEYESYYEMYDKFHNTLDPYINMLKALHNEIKQITVYTDNTIEKHSDYIIPMKYIEDTRWYKEISNEYHLQWFSDGKNDVFSAVQFVNKNYRNIHSILYIKVDYRSFFEPLYNLTNLNCGICILDRNNQVVFEESNFEGNREYAIPTSEMIQKNDEKISYNNIEYALLKAEIPGTSWYAYLYKPIPLIVQSSKHILYSVLFVVLICLIILLVVGYALSYVVVNRIEKLTDNMKNMDMDNFEVTVTSDSSDEIGILIQSFRKMISKIQILIQEVYKSEISKKKYEMKALQAQINPHFLYNSLSLINWKAIKVGADDISEMTQLLSTFYRTSLNKGGSIIAVNDELENTKAYIKIQAMMHNYSFDIEFDIDESIRDYYMINLMLQPLVENAICHGIDQKRNHQGKLKVVAKLDKEQLVFEVEDNGKGMAPEVCQTILTIKTKGYGIKNVYDRIRLTYGENYGLHYESIPNEKTKVIMRIPAIKDKVGFLE